MLARSKHVIGIIRGIPKNMLRHQKIEGYKGDLRDKCPRNPFVWAAGLYPKTLDSDMAPERHDFVYTFSFKSLIFGLS